MPGSRSRIVKEKCAGSKIECPPAQSLSRKKMPMDKEMDSLLEQLCDVFPEEGGAVFHRDYSCCMSCGHAEAQAEAKRMIEEEGDNSYCNYVFYHWQDTDELNKGAREVYLKHNLNEETKVKILKMIEEWSDYIYWTGDDSKAIYVTCDKDLMNKIKIV